MFGQSVGRTPLTLSFDLLRPRRDPKGDSGRDPVCPVILKQSDPKLEQEQQNTEAEDGCVFEKVLKIGKRLNSWMFSCQSSF